MPLFLSKPGSSLEIKNKNTAITVRKGETLQYLGVGFFGCQTSITLEKGACLIIDRDIGCSQIKGQGSMKLVGSYVKEDLELLSDLFQKKQSIEEMLAYYKERNFINIFHWPDQCEHDQEYVAKVMHLAQTCGRNDVSHWLVSKGIMKCEVGTQEQRRADAEAPQTNDGFMPSYTRQKMNARGYAKLQARDNMKKAGQSNEENNRVHIRAAL